MYAGGNGGKERRAIREGETGEGVYLSSFPPVPWQSCVGTSPPPPLERAEWLR